jgi:hypothetical protein
MKALKSARTLAASLGVLAGVALAATPAMAFDTVDWDWYKLKLQFELITVDIDVDIESTGLVEIEKLQIFFGDVQAYATVYGVHNYPADPGGEWQTVWFNCYCYDKVWVPAGLDADLELPSVVNAASAFGNLQVINADVPIFLHDGQFLADIDGNDPYDVKYAEFLSKANTVGYTGSGNTHTDIAVLFTIGAVYGLIDKAHIYAQADVAGIYNATVDNSSIAAGNLIAVTLESDVDGLDKYATTKCDYYGHCEIERLSNHVIQADITQFAFADVHSYAHVADVHVDNYKNLGDKVLVNNVATAIGNGFIATVTNIPVPEVPAP